MPLPILAKGALGLVAVGVTATGVVYASGFLDKNTTKEELISSLLSVSHPQKRFIKASDGTDPRGKEAGKRYKKDNESKKTGADVGSLVGGIKPDSSKVNNDEPAPDYFIQECKSRSSHKTAETSSELYKSVLKYCTRDTLVSDLISEYGQGKRILSNSSSEEEWKEVGKLYRDQNKVNSKSIDDWKFSDGGTTKDGDTLPTDYKKKCAEMSAELAFETTDIKYLNVLSGCSK